VFEAFITISHMGDSFLQDAKMKIRHKYFKSWKNHSCSGLLIFFSTLKKTFTTTHFSFVLTEYHFNSESSYQLAVVIGDSPLI
jgi:hypothetical protein